MLINRRLCGLLSLLMLWLVGIALPAHAAEGDTSFRVTAEESLKAGASAVWEDAKALLAVPSTLDRYDAVKLAGAVTAIGGTMALDHSIQDLVRRNSSNSGMNTAENLTTWLGPGPLLGLNAGVIVVGFANESYGGNSKLRETGLVSFEAEGFAIVASYTLKLIMGRARPDTNQGVTHFRPFSQLDSSFVSTHAAAGFAVASVFAQRYPGVVGWSAYGLATAVSGAMVYRDQHFASDVVAGALIGWGLGTFLNSRHSEDPNGWHLSPLVMERGQGGGLLLGKRF